MLDEVSPPHQEPCIDPDLVCPPYWENKECAAHFDERYGVPKKVMRQVQTLVDRTWKATATRDRSGKVPLGLEVMSVQRVEDRRMWANYVRMKRDILAKRNGRCAPPAGQDGSNNVKTLIPDNNAFQAVVDSHLNEFYLLHGTSPEGAMGISEDGFRLDLAGTNAGSMFGKGAYFAESSTKADEYAKEGKGIYRTIYAMLMCRVTCGQMYRMFHRDDALVQRVMNSGQYDSVLGDREASVGTYREFVVFRERQIYPEYVILYKRIYEDSEEETESESNE